MVRHQRLQPTIGPAPVRLPRGDSCRVWVRNRGHPARTGSVVAGATPYRRGCARGLRHAGRLRVPGCRPDARAGCVQRGCRLAGPRVVCVFRVRLLHDRSRRVLHGNRLGCQRLGPDTLDSRERAAARVCPDGRSVRTRRGRNPRARKDAGAATRRCDRRSALSTPGLKADDDPAGQGPGQHGPIFHAGLYPIVDPNMPQA